MCSMSRRELNKQSWNDPSCMEGSNVHAFAFRFKGLLQPLAAVRQAELQLRNDSDLSQQTASLGHMHI